MQPSGQTHSVDQLTKRLAMSQLISRRLGNDRLFGLPRIVASHTGSPTSNWTFFRQNIRNVQNSSKRGEFCMAARAKRSHAGPAPVLFWTSSAGARDFDHRAKFKVGQLVQNAGQLAHSGYFRGTTGRNRVGVLYTEGKTGQLARLERGT